MKHTSEAAIRSEDMVRDALGAPPGGLELSAADSASPEVIAAADRAARHWTADAAGPIAIGSAEHKRLSCLMFRDTFNPYRPSIIDWPALSSEARERLVDLPIWDIAVQTEGKARLRMLAYAHSLTDPDWHAATELKGVYRNEGPQGPLRRYTMGNSVSHRP